MERDQYLKFQTRKELATAFINKLEKTEMADADLIPALLHWIETGDNNYFEEYKTFHFSKCPEEKERELAEAKEKRDKIQAEIQKEIDEYEEYKKSYEKRLDEWRNWLNKIDDEINSTVVDFTPKGFRKISNFSISELVKGMADLYFKAYPDRKAVNNEYFMNRQIYVLCDGKHPPIVSVHLGKNGLFVLDVSTSGCRDFKPNSFELKPRPFSQIEKPYCIEF